jgi:hypothetical protein
MADREKVVVSIPAGGPRTTTFANRTKAGVDSSERHAAQSQTAAQDPELSERSAAFLLTANGR